jgi:hypothetical protein
MKLLAVHRALIIAFVALALLFAIKMGSAAARSGSTAAWAGAIASGVVAGLGVLYLLKAPHLRRP